MSVRTMPDGRLPVNRTPARLPGRSSAVPRSAGRSTVGRFLIADYNAEWRHRTPAELLLHAEQFWLVPPALQHLAYYRLAALAVEACERLLCLSIVDGDGAEVVQ